MAGLSVGSAHGGRLKARLPAALFPQINPDEQGWGYMKTRVAKYPKDTQKTTQPREGLGGLCWGAI